MQDEFDSRGFLISEGIDLVERARNLEEGSEDYARACNNAKWMFDAANRQNEIELKEAQLAQELKIHKDNNRNNLIRNVLEASKIALSGIAVAIGYKYNFKDNNIEFGKAFLDIKSGVTRFLHKW